ncbi:MAG: GAF domain-containing protein, partial [Anaerolineales bacterium]
MKVNSRKKIIGPPRATQTIKQQLIQREAELQIINSVQEGLASKVDIQGIYDLVGDKLYEIFKTDILFIAIYHPEKNSTSFPYGIVRSKKVGTMPDLELGGFSGEAIRKRQTIVVNEDVQRRSTEANSFVMAGDEEPLSLVYVPIIAGESVLGVVSLQSYNRGHIFPESDVRLLETLTNSMSVALQNAQSFKAEQERVAELQIINSIQQGLASKLDFQSIIDLVGEQVRAITKAYSVFIALYDKATELVSWPYWVNDDERIESSPEPLRKNITRRILYGSEPVNLGTEDEILAHDAIPPEGYTVGKSFLGVPFTIGDALLGALSLHDLENEHAFSHSEARLLQTLANSMGVALENARLFDETQRLFKAEQERVAELQIINSIQQGLAAELDFQAIIDLVGDKLSEVLNIGDLGITWYDEKNNLMRYLYTYEHGERIEISPRPPQPGGQFETMRKTRQPFVLNTVADYEKAGLIVLPGTDPSKSMVSIPVISGDRVLGTISIENYERENVYGESELRLLTTIAASLGTALENARLFDETQRLLKETEQRAAELAIINSVQQGLASKLEMQAIYDLVGDKIGEIFTVQAQAVSIRVLDQWTNLLHYPYYVSLEGRLKVEPHPLEEGGYGPHVIRTAKPLLLNHADKATDVKYGSRNLANVEYPESNWLGVPLLRGKEAWGVIVLENVVPENTFNESDVRLLQTLANSMSVALENARLFDETQRLLKETEQRAAELAIINSVQQGLASKLDMQAIFDLVGDKIRAMFNAQSVILSSFDHEKQ